MKIATEPLVSLKNKKMCERWFDKQYQVFRGVDQNVFLILELGLPFHF